MLKAADIYILHGINFISTFALYLAPDGLNAPHFTANANLITCADLGYVRLYAECVRASVKPDSGCTRYTPAWQKGRKP